MTRALFRDPTSERDVPWIPGQTVIVKACMGQHHECRDLLPGGVSTQAVVVAAPVTQADAAAIDGKGWVCIDRTATAWKEGDDSY